MKIHQSPPLTANSPKIGKYPRKYHSQPAVHDTFSCSRAQKPAFKSRFELDMLKNIFKSKNSPEKIAENEPALLAREILACCTDEDGKPDANIINFVKKVPNISDSDKKEAVIKFIQYARNKNGEFDPAFEKYFTTYLKVHKTLITTNLMDKNYYFDMKKLENLKKQVDFIQNAEPDYKEQDFKYYLKRNYDNNDRFCEKTLNAYKYLYENYGKFYPKTGALGQFNRIISACQNEDSFFNEKAFEIADKLLRRMPDAFLKEDGSEKQLSKIINLISLLNNNDNTADEKLFFELEKYKAQSDYPKIISLALYLRNYENLADYLDKLVDIYKDLEKTFAPQEKTDSANGWFISNEDTTIFQIIKESFGYKTNAGRIRDKEICFIYKSIIDNAKSFIREYGLEFGHLLSKKFRIDDKNFPEFKKTVEMAKANKQTLREGTEDLTDEDIIMAFGQIAHQLVDVKDFIGEKTLQYAFKLKLQNFCDFIRSTDKMMAFQHEDFKEIINPKSSERFKELQKSLEKQKSSLSSKKPPELCKIEAENNRLTENLKTEITNLKQKLKSSAGEAEKEQIKTQINQKSAQMRNLKNQVLKLYHENGFGQELEKIRQIQSEMNLILKNSLTDSEEILGHLMVLGALKNLTEKEHTFYIERMKSKTPESKNELKTFLNRKIFKIFDIEYDKNLSERLNLTGSKYMSALFNENYDDFKDYFSKICTLLKQNPQKSTTEIFNSLEQNIKTKNQFKKLGIDYDKWVNVDKNSFVPIVVTTDVEKAKQSAVKNIEADLNDECMTKIPENEARKIFQALENKGFELKENNEVQYDADGYENGFKNITRIYKDGNPLSFKDIGEAISAIKEVFNTENFWNQKQNDETVESARQTILNHILKLRENEFKNAQNFKNDEISRLEVHKTDMNDISHSLFLGNHASCCTAVGTGCNSWSAPAYILNKCISSIEVEDENNFVGNTMCYIAKVDGKPALVLDNIELTPKYQFNDKIRDAIFDYAQKLCKEIGKPDLPIYAGPFRHKVNLEHYPIKQHIIQITGSSGDDEVYIDFMTDGTTLANGVHTAKLYKII